MRIPPISLISFAAVTTVITAGLASAAPHFHTDFDEASLGAIAGLNIDTPSTTGADSGTVTLDTANQTLDLTANGANTWTAREGAPIAWVAAPTVAMGDTWYVETQITHTNSTGGNSTYDQAGITFYSGTPGANPGSENTGTSQSLFFGINDWNAWSHQVQGFADNDPNFSAAATMADDTLLYRVEVTENGTSDLYNFFYKEDAGDAWTQFGTPDLSQDFDNTSVGLFLKSHNNNTTASTQFDFLTVDIIVNTDITDPTDSEPDGMGDNWETFYFGDLSRDGTLDFDSDGRTDLQEWGDGTNPTEADVDGDGLDDGEEFSFGTDPLDGDSDGDGWGDGEEISAGSNPNDASSSPSIAPEPDVYASLPQPTRDAVVVFSEIHYHPAGDNSSLEYVELHNLMAIDVDMSNWRLRGDADFDFPEGTVLAAGGYLVVASDPSALAAATGYSSALGPLSGLLSNGGGRLRLYNNNRSFRTLPGGVGSSGEILDDQEGRRIMDEIEYSDVFPWPLGADGSGASLAKRRTNGGTAHPVNWSASVQPNGTPGIANPKLIKAQLAINEVTATSDPLFQLELYNYGTSAILLGGMVLSSSDPAHTDYVLPSASLAPGAFLVINATTLGFTPADNNRLFLFAAGKESLIDVARVDDSARARHSDGTGRWLRPNAPTLGSVNSFDIPADIVINEIFYNAPAKLEDDGTGSSGHSYTERDEEWIELYNRGVAPVDLTGWRLDGGINFDFPAGTTILAGGYLIIAKDAAALSAKHPSVIILGDYDQRLGNGGDLIVLKDSNSNPADEVRYYDSGKWHGKADGAGASLELRDPDADNRFSGAWASSDETARSSWETYTYEGVATDNGLGDNIFHELQVGFLDAGEVLIDDVSVIENGSTEFMQNGDFESDSVGTTADKWRAIGTHGSHGKTVVVTDPDDSGNRCLHLVATGPTGNKHNKLETTFADSQQVVVGNTYRIQFRAKWLSGVPLLNTRLYFNYLQRTHVLDSPMVWGTPGQANSISVANAGPVLTGLQHSPVVPDAGDAITVSIDASDVDGIANLSLFYSTNDGAFQTVAMSLGSDGRYSALLPGQSSNTIVRFYVRGQDSSNATSFFPADGPTGGAFFKVQDGLAHTGGLRQNIRVIMSEGDRQFLFLNTNRMSNDRFPVTVIENESTIYYNVGLRLKASGHGRYQSGGYGLNLRFQPDNLFRGAHPGIAIERTNPLQELFAKQLMNRAGGGSWSFYDDVANVITPTASDTGTGLISMARHSANFFDGLFPDAEEPGTLFNLELHYSPNGTTGGPEGLKIGNPYNHTNGAYSIEDLGSDKETYRWGYQIRGARDRDDYSKIVALNQAMSLDGEELKLALDELIDADQWMRTFAQTSLNGTDDILGRLWDHNFRFYVRPTDGKIIALQWDLDRTFRLSTSGSLTTGLQSAVPSTNRDGVVHPFAKIFGIPQYRRLFDGHVEDQIDTTFNSTYSVPMAAGLATHTGGSANTYTNYVTSRANFLLGSLPASQSFGITTNGGSDFAHPGSVVELQGDAWIDVFSIEVNGIITPVTWIDAETWFISAPLSPGANALILTALDNRGTVVGTDTISVTNTSLIDLANASNIIISELHYNPAAPSAAEIAAGFTDADDFEFVELTNTDLANEIDLTGVSFTDGVLFDFPAGTILAPGGRLLVVKNQAAFEFRYGIGGLVIAGEYTGQFSNGGELVWLEAADTTPIADFTYGDEIPWPDGADGSGYSLVMVGQDPANPLDWRMSTTINGNPGGSDGTPFTGGDLLAYSLAGDPDFEIIDDTFVLHVRVNLGADASVIQARFSTDLVDWTSVPEGALISQENHGDGTATLSFLAPLTPSTTKTLFGAFRVELR